MEKPVLSLHQGKKNPLLDRPGSQISHGINNATHDSGMSLNDIKASGITENMNNHDLNEFLKLAREANNNSSQAERANYGAEMKNIADKANIRFSNKSSVADSLSVPVRAQRNSQKRS